MAPRAPGPRRRNRRRAAGPRDSPESDGGSTYASPSPSADGDAVHFDERAPWDPAVARDRRAHRRVRTETAAEYRVHPVVILDVVQIHVDLEHLVHRGADLFELRLDLV